MKNIIMILSLFLAVTSAQAQWGAWGEDVSSNTKNRNEALNMAQVIPGKVVGVRKVQLTPSDASRTTGAAIGTISGIAVANQIGDSELTNVVAGLAGAVVAQSMVSTESAHEVLVNYFSPSRKKPWTVAVTTKEYFARGEDVYLVQDSRGVRIARY